MKRFLIPALVVAALLALPAIGTPRRAAEPVNVTAYGAVPDDGRDDTAAIASACKAAVAAARPVYAPAGIYNLASTLVLPRGTSLSGAGGYLSAKTSAPFPGTWLKGAIRYNSDVTVSDLKVGDRLGGATVAPASSYSSNVRFTRVRFRGGGYGGGIVGCDTRTLDGFYVDDCRVERNLGVWSSSGGAGGFWFAADTSSGRYIRNVYITNSVFGVSNGVASGQPTYNIVFWQSEETGSGYWGGIHIVGNTFETTGEFSLDFDGLKLRDAGHNDVEIRGNLIKGGGLIRADGSHPSWAYTICVEPTRKGTVISGNTLYRAHYNVFKTTKNTTDTVFRDNIIDLRVANGVAFHYTNYYRTINLYSGARNQILNNTIYLPATPPRSSQVIYNIESGTVISGNRIIQ